VLPAGSPRSCLWPGQTRPCPHLCHPSGLTPAAPTRWLSGPGWQHSRRQEGKVGVRTEDGTGEKWRDRKRREATDTHPHTQ
jgi:hypothetical protein